MFSEIVLTDDLQKGLEIFRDTPAAVLVDVRTPEEYGSGHVPGSVNVPLNVLEDGIYDAAPAAEAPGFLDCRSGNRSTRAAALLREMGYEKAVSIGGVMGYTGPLEK